MQIQGHAAFATTDACGLGQACARTLAANIALPKRLGKPDEFAALATHVVNNGHLDGAVIRLGGALCMAPH